MIESFSLTTQALVWSADMKPSSARCRVSGLYSLSSTVSLARSGLPSGANRVNCWRTEVTTQRKPWSRRLPGKAVPPQRNSSTGGAWVAFSALIRL